MPIRPKDKLLITCENPRTLSYGEAQYRLPRSSTGQLVHAASHDLPRTFSRRRLPDQITVIGNLLL